MSGDYDTAVFCAFKEVEVAVRRVSGLPPTKIGVDLMRDAFKPTSGLLTDIGRPEPEQVAERDPLAAAIAYFKISPRISQMGWPVADALC
jgi:hypothetical protein